MKTKLGIAEMDNREVKINVKIAHQIFLKCFQRAGLSSESLMPKTLEAALDAAFIDNPISASFLRNKFGGIKKMLKKDVPGEKVTFFYTYIYTLAYYAGISDFENTNSASAANYPGTNDVVLEAKIKVLFTTRPYKLFDFLRLVERGFLEKKEDNWQLTGLDGTIVTGKTLRAEMYTMKGDQHSHWLKVDYLTERTNGCLFFAEMDKEVIAVQSQIGVLFSFFSKNLHRVDNTSL